MSEETPSSPDHVKKFDDLANFSDKPIAFKRPGDKDWRYGIARDMRTGQYDQSQHYLSIDMAIKQGETPHTSSISRADVQAGSVFVKLDTSSDSKSYSYQKIVEDLKEATKKL